MMRRGTNSSGPSGKLRRVLRVGMLAGLAVGLTLGAGILPAKGQVRGRASHFGGGFGGGFHGRNMGDGWNQRQAAFGPRTSNAGRERFGNWQQGPRGNQREGYFQRNQNRRSQGSNRGVRPGTTGPRYGGATGVRRGVNGYRTAYAPQQYAGRNMPRIGPREGNARASQQHLPQWWAAHRSLSPEQQAQAMRREPGFRSLPQAQQQRLLNRLRNFDSRPPVQQQRMLDRVEMFERLSPERQQEIRGASAAFNRMPPQRKQTMIQAFRQLRQMPPQEREQMLRSGYGQQFSPQERTVLGNLLSIEPYQPSASQPYFGRPH